MEATKNMCFILLHHRAEHFNNTFPLKYCFTVGNYFFSDEAGPLALALTFKMNMANILNASYSPYDFSPG